MSQKRPRGFTLIEILVTVTMLLLLMGAVFWAFDYGTRAFYRSNTQQNAQAEMTRAYSRIRKDLRHTHFRSVLIRERTMDTFRRDALSLASLKNWSDEESFDELNGLPMWDRYVVYYATDSGKLIRSLLDEDFPDFSPAPFSQLSDSDHLNENPNNNDSSLQTTYQTISRSVEVFQVSLDPSQDMVFVKILLNSKGGRKTEKSEIRFDISPQNTWPQAKDSI